MGLRGKKKKGGKKKKKRSRFSFFERYAVPIGFLVTAGLLVAGYLPEYNPVVYLVLGPFLFRLLFDILSGKTVRRRILRTLHPKILFVDVIVMVGGLFALYTAGYWTLADITPVVNVFNVFLEQIGYTINLSDAGAANITQIPSQ